MAYGRTAFSMLCAGKTSYDHAIGAPQKRPIRAAFAMERMMEHTNQVPERAFPSGSREERVPVK